MADSTGCFVLTRPTTCELLLGFLSTFASPVILTSGAARCTGVAEKNALEKSRGRPAVALWRGREISRKVAGAAGVKG